MKNYQYYVFMLLLLLLPFNALPIYFLGAGGSEGALYPGILLVLIFFSYLLQKIFKKGMLPVYDVGLFYIIFCFLLISFFSFLLNIEDIVNAKHMDKQGLTRCIGQYIQLMIGLGISYSIAYTICTENKLYKIFRHINVAMIIFILFAIFQFFAYEIQSVFLSIYKIIGNFIYHEDIITFAVERRHALHSFTQEPSHLSMYIGVIGPFVMGYGLYKKRYFLSIVMIVVLLLSLSRTGYVIMLFELMLFSYFYYFKFFRLKSIMYFFIGGSIVLFLLIFFTPIGNVVLSLFDVENNGSNAARYAGAYSALQVWWNNNILLGVGLGQTGFLSIEYLPEWGYLSNDVWDTLNEKRWPPIHNLLIRILAETGLLGLVVWLGIYFYILVKIHKVIYKKYIDFNQRDYIGYAVFTSICGVVLTMFTRELFTNMLIWISLGIALAYLNIYKGVSIDKKEGS